MCAIIGAVLHNITQAQLPEVNYILEFITQSSRERGRDGRGYMYAADNNAPIVLRNTDRIEDDHSPHPAPTLQAPAEHAVLIGNLRAEPTTEFVQAKSPIDQQPYQLGNWSIVHNGTIANDKDVRTNRLATAIDSAAIVEMLNIESDTAKSEDPLLEAVTTFEHTVEKIVGSYAILAHTTAQPHHLMVACNYRPVWYIDTEYGVFFASCRSYFPPRHIPAMLDPYSVNVFGYCNDGMLASTKPLHAPLEECRALVVCSGGLDSVVAATYAQRVLGYDIHLIHFVYGCKAEEHEVSAIKAVAKVLGVGVTIFPMDVYDPTDSPLLDPGQAISNRDAGAGGAEFAHEWVPARNLVMLSLATAYAEAKGYDTILLGNNLEEAGAYPDNEPEFIKRFNDLMPFAVADGKQVTIEMPVGNLMKHEIVALGNEVNAPMDLTWSCYSNGEQHCGKCGPCFMRKTAFGINNLPEVITYENE